ncbi:MAG: NAD(P)-binding protein [Pyrinomonadaceae bacterium]
MFTRREILKSFLGLPLAMAACRSVRDLEGIEGEIVGANNNIGHQLRDRRDWVVPETISETLDAAIIGGGVAGLTAGRHLAKNGVSNYRIFELEPRLGGTSASGETTLKTNGNPKVGYPWGAHYLPVPFKENEDLVALLDEMSVIESRDAEGNPVVLEELLVRDPEERVFYKGRWYEGLYLHAGETTEDVAQLKRFEALLADWIGKKDSKGRRAFSVPVENASDDAEFTALDKISFSDWLRSNGFTSERLLKYCDYACRDDYGLLPEQTSAWAGLFYFCSRVPVAGEESEPFIAFPEGNGRFVKHLASASRDKAALNQVVIQAIPNDDGVDLVCLDIKTMGLKRIRAKQAVFSAPVFLAPYIIRGFRENAPFNANAFEHNAWFVANLFLKDRPKNRFPKDFPLSWDNVLYESKSLGYVAATHQLGIDYGPTVLTYYYPMAEKNLRMGLTKLLALDWKELADIVVSDLETAHIDIRSQISRIDIMRWGHAMISPRTGFMWGGDREKATAPFRNIHFAHSDLSGIALFENAFFHGNRAAKALLERLRG